MATIRRTEIARRGFFGWLFLIAFWGFNLLTAGWLISYWHVLGQMQTAPNEAAGHAIGSVIGTSIVVFFWVAGAVVFGLLAMLTRGRKTVIVEHSDQLMWLGDDRKRRPTSSTLGDYFYFGCMAVAILGVLIYSTQPMVVFALIFAGSIATLFIHDLGVLFLDSGIGRWIIITPLFGMGLCYLLGYRLW